MQQRLAQRRITAVWSLRLGALVVLVGAWWAAVDVGAVSPLVLPDPSAVLREFVALGATVSFYGSAVFTLAEIAIAFVLAAVVGLGFGVLCSRSRTLARVTEPLFVWAYLAPSVLFLPLFIFWLGAGPRTTVLFAAFSAFPPIAYSTIRALTSIDQRYVRMGRAFGASAWQLDRWIKFPASLPLITTGLRIGAASALITVVLAEMLASTQGLAHDLARSQQMFNGGQTYAYIVGVMILSAIVQMAIQRGLRARWTVNTPAS